MKRALTTAAALAALLAFTAPATIHAQSTDTQASQKTDQDPGWDWGWGHMRWGHQFMGDWDGYGGPVMGRGPGRHMAGDPAQFVEGRIAFLRTELKITDGQEPLFVAFAESLRTAAADMKPMHRRMWSGDIPQAFPDRLQLHIDLMTSRLKAMEVVKAAAVPLYAALSDEQKKTADQVMMPMGPMGMM